MAEWVCGAGWAVGGLGQSNASVGLMATLCAVNECRWSRDQRWRGVGGCGAGEVRPSHDRQQ